MNNDHLRTEYDVMISAKLVTDVGTLFMQDSPSCIIRMIDILNEKQIPVFSAERIADTPDEEMWTLGASRGMNMNLCHIYCASKDVLRNIAYKVSDAEFLRDANVFVGKYARYRYRFMNGSLIHEYLDPGYSNVPADWM